jgi:hypothetical protein
VSAASPSRARPAALAHVVLSLQQDGVRGVVAVIHCLQVGAELVFVGQAVSGESDNLSSEETSKQAAIISCPEGRYFHTA